MLNVYVDNLSMEETEDRIYDSIKNKYQIFHSGINAVKVVDAQSDKAFREGMNESDIINPDGQSVVWASRFLRTPLKERVPGIELMERLVAKAQEKKYTIYFLGASEEVVSSLVKKYSEIYSPSIIAGYRNGYFSDKDEEEIVSDIVQSNANILFVAITSPKKEIFLHTHRDALRNVNLIMGVGGSFDVVAGKVKRAPVWMQKSGLEWFYRFLQEPRRMWKRYLVGNTKFILLVLKERFTK